MDNHTLSRSNKVLIFPDSVRLLSYAQSLQQNSAGIEPSVLIVGGHECQVGPDKPASVCVIAEFLRQIGERTNVGCSRPAYWWKHREQYARFRMIVEKINTISDESSLEIFIAHYGESIRKQLRLLTIIEKSKYVLLVLTDFQNFSAKEQPELAEAIHRLVFGASANFLILTTNPPEMYRKGEFGEVGIQRNHDYYEVLVE